MYKRDVKEIVNYVSQDYDEGLRHVVTFVVGTIRERFYRAEEVTEELLLNGANSKMAWGNRKKALVSFREQKHNLRDLRSQSIPAAIKELRKITGVGTVKAGFILQLLGRDVACLDSHNLNKLGISASYFNSEKRVEEYVALTQQRGAEYWWDSWCELIANRYPKHFKNADEVSLIHAKAIKGE